MLETETRLCTIQENLEFHQYQLQDLKLKYQKNECEIVRLHKDLDSAREAVRQYESQKRELEHLNDQWENSARVLEYSKQDLEERLYQAEESVILCREELDEVSNANEAEMQRLRDEVRDLRHAISILESQHGDIKKIQALEIALNKAVADQSALKAQLIRSPENNGGNALCVYVRIRPVLPSDSCKIVAVSSDSKSVKISMFREAKDKARVFEFLKVFGMKDSEEELFTDIRPSIHYFAGGGCGCVMSYGQTGSGKTFTMNVLIEKSLDLLDTLLCNNEKLSFHCIEVYNEQVRNLLSDGVYSKNWKDILSMSEVLIHSDWHRDVRKLIALASAKRNTKCTESNEYSSRSHCIYTFLLEISGRKCTLQFVDLAGSERVAKSMVAGEVLKETLHINKSLSALHDVVAALETKSSHVPYRNSLLTRILKMSLASQESKVSIILNCNPTEDSVNETISTLNLGVRLKSIDLAWAIRKDLKNEEVARTLNLLDKERTEKNALVRKVEKMARDLEGYCGVVKEKDNKIAQLLCKIKQMEKNYCDDIDLLKKEIQISKLKHDEATKKLAAHRYKTEQEKKKLKINGPKLFKSSDYTAKQGNLLVGLHNQIIDSSLNVTFSKSQNSTRIPRPKNISCNTSKINIIV